MQTITARLAIILLVLLMAATTSMAAEPIPDPPIPADLQQLATTTLQQLHSDRWESRDPASMRSMLTLHPRLMQAKAYNLAAQMALEAILAVPGALDRVEVFLVQRMDALQGAGRHQDALATAKSFYNVVTMRLTRDAIQHAGGKLAAAFPEQRDIERRYFEEQLEGFRPSTQPFQRDQLPPKAKLLLSTVKVDPEPYENALKREQGESFGALTATGNLLLLSDKPEEAMRVFEKAYVIASEDQLTTAAESLARAMKAIDGTIGRANAFVLSIRPKL
jgi:hypothetical protein